jgi:hypothetical protein
VTPCCHGRRSSKVAGTLRDTKKADIPSSVMPGLVPGIHAFRIGKKDVDGRVKPGHDGENYSITACSAGAACARSAALVEPIMIASGIEHRMNNITS